MRGSLVSRLLGKLAMIAPGGFTVRPWLHKKRGVKIGNNVWISQYVYIDEVHPENVVIKENVTIGLRCTIFAHFYMGRYSTGKNVGKVVIEKDVYIGPNCTILKGVTIGEGSVIAAGSVVSKNVPPGCSLRTFTLSASGQNRPPSHQRREGGLRGLPLRLEKALGQARRLEETELSFAQALIYALYPVTIIKKESKEVAHEPRRDP